MTSDKSLIRRRFESQFSRYDRLALVQQQICDQLSELIGEHTTELIGEHTQPKRALEVGIGTGFLTRHLVKRYPMATWFLNDISPETEPFISKHIRSNNNGDNCNNNDNNHLSICPSLEFLWGDAEAVSFPKELDLIATSSTVQWFDNLPAFINKCAQSLNINGILAMTTFGTENFREIKSASNEGLSYYGVEELRTMMQNAGLEIVSESEYCRSLKFSSPTEVLHHIKATGVNGISHKHWTRQRLAQFEERYHAACPSGITLTYHPILIVAVRQ